MNYSDNELVYMVKESEDALSMMIHKYEPLYRKLAFSFIKNNKNKGVDVEDLIQQCRIATCYALESYNTNSDIKFYSYLLVCLKRAIKNYTRSVMKYPDIYYYMEDENTFYNSISSQENVDNELIEKDLIDLFRKFILDLNFIDGCIFELRFNNFSYKEIAEILEISVKRVDNVLLKIRKKFEKIIYYEY